MNVPARRAASPPNSFHEKAVLGYRWNGRRSRLFFQTREGRYNSESLITFLTDLRRELRGQEAILVRGGLPAHKSRGMKEHLLMGEVQMPVSRP